MCHTGETSLIPINSILALIVGGAVDAIAGVFLVLVELFTSGIRPANCAYQLHVLFDVNRELVDVVVLSCFKVIRCHFGFDPSQAAFFFWNLRARLLT